MSFSSLLRTFDVFTVAVARGEVPGPVPGGLWSASGRVITRGVDVAARVVETVEQHVDDVLSGGVPTGGDPAGPDASGPSAPVTQPLAHRTLVQTPRVQPVPAEQPPSLVALVASLVGVSWTAPGQGAGPSGSPGVASGSRADPGPDTAGSSGQDATLERRAGDGGTHPGDLHLVTTAVFGLAVGAASLALTVAGRAASLPALPASLTSLPTLVDSQPRLRRLLEGPLGPSGTDLVLQVANAALQAVTQGTLSIALEVAQQVGHLAEVSSRRDTWLRCEAGLCSPERPALQVASGLLPEPAPRPVPLPPGPIETYSDRVGAGGLAAAGAALALTRSADPAGQALLVAAPRAARYARESYASSLAVRLGRAGVVTMDPAVWRRLDRVDAVVVEARVLHGTRSVVLAAEPAWGNWTAEKVWSAAQRLLWQAAPSGGAVPTAGLQLRPDAADAPTATGTSRAQVLVEDGDVVGRVLVGRELDPLSDELLGSARAAGLRVLLTTDASAAEVAGLVDQLVPAGTSTVEAVRALQADGHAVAVVAGPLDQEALTAADVGVGVVGQDPTSAVPWSGDLVVPGLDAAARVLAAAASARRTSRVGVTLAASGSALGGLLLVGGGPLGAGGRPVLPVHVTTAVSLVVGAVSGWRAGAPRALTPVLRVLWHALAPDEVLARLAVVPPARGAARGLPGLIGPEPSGSPVPAVVRRSLRAAARLGSHVGVELADPLTPVLAVGAAASAALGSRTDAVLVIGVLVGNSLISGLQRLGAERALSSLLVGEQLTAHRILVGPDAGPRARSDSLDGVVEGAAAAGPTERVLAATLVPGDRILLNGGDVVPADARLVAVDGLEVDESSVTGESVTVEKQVAATPGAGLGDRACMVYEGTTVNSGTGEALVVAVGAATATGRAVALSSRVPPPGGITARLKGLTRRVLPATLVGGATVTGLSLAWGQPVRAALASGVAVGVSAVPEGLPVMATVAQLAAARRLSAQGILVRASRTVEALGRVDTVCFDKTGTLTEGRLSLTRVATLDGEWEPGERAAWRVLRAAARATSSDENRPVLHSTDRAVLEAAAAIDGGRLVEDWDELGDVPFDSNRGFSAALGRTPTALRLVVKGAPEVLLPRCTRVHRPTGDGGSASQVMDRAAREQAQTVVDDLAARGLRVLAVARRNFPPEGAQLSENLPDEVEDLSLLGFVALADTPRAAASATVHQLARAGLRPVMITGDHPLTARAIATQVGIPEGAVVTGGDLEGLDEQGWNAVVAGATVFARISPEQKVRIVEAMHRVGRVVAMTGDGSNDAAAIRLADVGIGIAAHGSTAARDAADLVLLRPDVSLLLAAVAEGRAMWARVREAVAILVGGNLGELAFTVLGAAMTGQAPIGTRQLLLVNMLTDLFPAMAIALGPPTMRGPADDAPEHQPGQGGEVLDLGSPAPLGAPLLQSVAVRGTTTAAAATVAWWIGRVTGDARRASTMGLAALVGAQLGQTLLAGCSPMVLATVVGSAGALVTIVSVPGISEFFGCTPLDPFAWGVVVACSAGATAVGALAPRLLRATAPTPAVQDHAAAPPPPPLSAAVEKYPRSLPVRPGRLRTSAA